MNGRDAHDQKKAEKAQTTPARLHFGQSIYVL